MYVCVFSSQAQARLGIQFHLLLQGYEGLHAEFSRGLTRVMKFVEVSTGSRH